MGNATFVSDLPPLPAYETRPMPDLLPFISDFWLSLIAPHIVFDDGTVLRQGPPVEPISIPADGLAAFAEQWPEILADYTASRQSKN